MRHLTFLLAALLTFAVAAQDDVELKPGHPERYTVQKGDTLWDIATRFLESPWLWPDVWYVNPQIENPHLIYPGDVINLTYEGGRPRLAVERGPKRLSPRIRVVREAPIPTIPLGAVEGYLERSWVVTETGYERLPYVVANEEGRLRAVEGQQIYVRGLPRAATGAYAVVRVENVYRDGVPPPDKIYRPHLEKDIYVPRDPERPPTVHDPDKLFQGWFGDVPILGVALRQVAAAQVAASGDPATLDVTGSLREIKAGDRLVPYESRPFDPYFQPHAPQTPMRAQVIATMDERPIAGTMETVVINRGSHDGVEPGHVFTIFQPGQTIRDEVKYPRTGGGPRATGDKTQVRLPDERAGELMIYRVYDRLSYGLIMNATRQVEPGFRVVTPG